MAGSLCLTKYLKYHRLVYCLALLGLPLLFQELNNNKQPMLCTDSGLYVCIVIAVPWISHSTHIGKNVGQNETWQKETGQKEDG